MCIHIQFMCIQIQQNIRKCHSTEHTHTYIHTQPIAHGVLFLQSQIPLGYRVLQVSFATFRWKETNWDWGWRLRLINTPNAIGCTWMYTCAVRWGLFHSIYVHAFIHSCLYPHTYTHTNTHTFMIVSTNIHTYKHTREARLESTPTFMIVSTYIHTYIHSREARLHSWVYPHTYIHTNTHARRGSIQLRVQPSLSHTENDIPISLQSDCMWKGADSYASMMSTTVMRWLRLAGSLNTRSLLQKSPIKETIFCKRELYL